MTHVTGEGRIVSLALPDAPFRVDVHCHHIPDFYRLALSEHGIVTAGGIPIPVWTPEYAVAFMTEYGIQSQVVSISEPGVYFLPTETERRDLAQRINDYTKDALIDGSLALADRFGGFAVLPLGPDLSAVDVTNACAEARRTITKLGMDGVGLFSSYDGNYLGDPRLDPLMKVLNDLGAFVFIHPVTPAAYPDLILPTFLYEFPFDTTRAVVSMAYAKIFSRFPRIRWLIAHAGGTIPFIGERARTFAATAGLARGRGERSTIEKNFNFSRLFYDTALSPAPSAMKAVLATAPRSHIMFATDWPFAGPVFVVPGDPAPQLSETFTDAQRREVERTNALDQLPRLAARLGVS
ncbi:MAG: amidohydrolase family protein [Nocardioides sp.]|uniref:amidohydrolase family protein n=1 Tax=Nocardioides sp. TaxID=35761 RepID=UPI0039E49D7B